MPEAHDISSSINLLELDPQIPGYSRFLGAYLLVGDKKALVDVGPSVSAPGLLRLLGKLGLGPGDIDYVFLTHIHMDHAGGIGTLIKQMGKALVVAHPRARRHLVDPAQLWEASVRTLGDVAAKYGPIEPVPEDRVLSASEGMPITLGRGLQLELYLTPGHAPHHMSLFMKREGILFAGEAAGVCLNGKVRVATPPPFDLAESVATIDRLIALDPHMICYAHLGCYDGARDKLLLMRHKLQYWHRIVQSETALGTTPDKIAETLRREDPDLGYLDTIGKDEYSREMFFLINSVRGMAGSNAGG